MLNRIKQYIDLKGLSVSKFEKSIGMSNASFGKSLKSGGTIGCDKLGIILNTYPDINIEWILTGRGVMLKSDQPKAVENNDTCPICKEKDKRIEQLEHQIKRYENDIDWLKTQIDCQDETEPNTKRRSA